MRQQRGMSMIGLMFVAVVVVVVAIVVMQVVPVYAEYFSVQRALKKTASDGIGKSPADLRDSFRRSAEVDNIKVVTPADVVIQSSGNRVSLQVQYQAKVHLAGPASLVFDFDAQASNGSTE